MTYFTGTVQCIMIGDDYAITALVVQGTQETFYLWSGAATNPPVGTPEPEPPPRYRIMQSNWVALLRQAMASNMPVTIDTWGGNSSLVMNLQLGAE
jgi:hypothetical protein